MKEVENVQKYETSQGNKTLQLLEPSQKEMRLKKVLRKCNTKGIVHERSN